MDKDLGTPWPAEDQFRDVEKLGRLLIVTVREEGQIVGYWVGALLPHLHYKDCGLMCYTDMYFLAPSARKGNVGIRMLALAEEEAKKRGATKFYISCKVHQNHTELLERIGFKKSDFMFTKRLDK